MPLNKCVRDDFVENILETRFFNKNAIQFVNYFAHHVFKQASCLFMIKFLTTRIAPRFFILPAKSLYAD